jgi:MerR family transcriptional regulator, heat shock protein HspR
VERNPEQGLYIISIAANLAEVHPQTLRMYERRGLLRPSRTAKNRRCYSDDDIERLRHIQELTQQEGLNLSGVRMVLEMEDQMEELRRQLSEMQNEMKRVRDSVIEDMNNMKRRFALSKVHPTGLTRKR